MSSLQLPAAQSIDELRALLMKTHGTTVGKDDPVLMVYSIHRAALDEIAQALECARTAMADAVTEASAAHSAEVKAALGEIVETIASDALRERLAAMQEAAVLADRTAAGMKKNLRRIAILSAANWLAAIVCVGVLALLVS